MRPERDPAARAVVPAIAIRIFVHAPASTSTYDSYKPGWSERIGYSLGFDDPSYFSRFFRGATGRSPSEFRADR